MTEEHDFKVEYHAKQGGTSKAYVTGVREGFAVGEDKHTDRPVVVSWDGEKWVEV